MAPRRGHGSVIGWSVLLSISLLIMAGGPRWSATAWDASGELTPKLADRGTTTTFRFTLQNDDVSSSMKASGLTLKFEWESSTNNKYASIDRVVQAKQSDSSFSWDVIVPASLSLGSQDVEIVVMLSDPDGSGGWTTPTPGTLTGSITVTDGTSSQQAATFFGLSVLLVAGLCIGGVVVLVLIIWLVVRSRKPAAPTVVYAQPPPGAYAPPPPTGMPPPPPPMQGYPPQGYPPPPPPPPAYRPPPPPGP